MIAIRIKILVKYEFNYHVLKKSKTYKNFQEKEQQMVYYLLYDLLLVRKFLFKKISKLVLQPIQLNKRLSVASNQLFNNTELLMVLLSMLATFRTKNKQIHVFSTNKPT